MYPVVLRLDHKQYPLLQLQLVVQMEYKDDRLSYTIAGERIRNPGVAQVVATLVGLEVHRLRQDPRLSVTTRYNNNKGSIPLALPYQLPCCRQIYTLNLTTIRTQMYH